MIAARQGVVAMIYPAAFKSVRTICSGSKDTLDPGMHILAVLQRVLAIGRCYNELGKLR